MKKIYLFLLLFMLVLTHTQAQQQPTTVQGIPYDFSKVTVSARNMNLSVPATENFTMGDIDFWVGEGSKKAAFAVQWNDDRETNALVWGYYFDGNKCGIDLIRDIVQADPRLYILIERADASMGYTICGIGYDANGDGNIALTHTSTGQILSPSEEGIFYTLGHYDYEDYKATDPEDLWGAGWYQSYWSYWVKEENENFGYSSLGASSRKLSDGSWDGWNFARNMQTTGFKPFAAAQTAGYTTGTIFLNNNKENPANSTLHYLTQKSEWEHNIYQTANEGRKLNTNTHYATIFGDNLYLISGNTDNTNGNIIIADAKKLTYKTTLDNIDGRSFVGITPQKGYVGTKNGIYIIDLENMSAGQLINDSENNGETGTMIFTDGYVFAVQRSKGVLIIDATNNIIKQSIAGSFSSIAQTPDGNLWGAAGNKLVKIDPVTLQTEEISLPEYCKIGENWNEWGAGSFFADTESNTLYWINESSNASSNTIFRFKPGNMDSLESPFFTLPDEGKADKPVFCGNAVRLNPQSGQLILTAVTQESNKAILYYVDSQTGDLLSTIETTNDFLCPVIILPDESPSISGVENTFTIPLNSTPIQFSLTGKISDKDNIDKNIAVSILSENPELVSAELQDNEVVIAPQPNMSGDASVIISALSNGKTVNKKIQISITRALEKITLNKKEITIKQGMKDTLSVTFTPGNATNKTLKWSYSSYSIASVDKGIVTGRGVGEGFIYVKSEEGDYCDTCKITVVKEPVAGISLNKLKTSVFVNQKDTVLATIMPLDASVQNIIWTSSDKTIAEVASYAGYIIGKKEGTATITAKTSDGGFTASCEVSVTFNPATGITLNKTEMPLVAPKTETLAASFVPANASNKDVTWISEDPEIASVSTYGSVKGLKGGKTKITVQSKDNPELTATCEITVDFIAATGITLNETEKTMVVNQTYYPYNTITPENASNKNIICTSSDDNIVAVQSTGYIKAVSPGTAILTATTADGGFTSTCKITVVASIPVTGIELGESEIWLKVNGTKQPKRTFIPSNATNQKYSYLSENEAVATVSQYGQIKGISLGTTNIIVATEDGGYTATCTVHVTEDVENVVLDTKEKELIVSDQYQLSAIVAPSTAMQTITWSTTNKQVATVDEAGVVTALQAGQAFIVAASADKSAITDTCALVIKNQISTGITLDKIQKEISVREGFQLKATVLPENTTNPRVRWSTSNYSVAAVSSYGYVTATGPGTTIIKAISQDGGSEAVCTVTVKQSAESITLNELKKDLPIGKEFQLVATVLPENTTHKEVEWSTSDEEIAKVSDNGLVSTFTSGSVIITATVIDGGLTATCNISVLPASIESENILKHIVYTVGNTLYIKNCQGYIFNLSTLEGELIKNMEIKGDNVSYVMDIPSGIYILQGTGKKENLKYKVLFRR